MASRRRADRRRWSLRHLARRRIGVLRYVGRGIEQAVNREKAKYGLYNRLASHASGRLSGDQFCVYVANRLVLPELTPEVIEQFRDGSMTLDQLTKAFIHEHFEFQFCIVPSSSEAYALEIEAQKGDVFGVKPLLNPIG